MSPQQRLNEEALARRRAAYQASQGAPAPTVAQVRPKLTAAEAKTYIQLRQAGKTDAEAYEALAALRQLTGTLPTDAEVNASVAKRNSTGRW